jgi:hypothetical protein
MRRSVIEIARPSGWTIPARLHSIVRCRRFGWRLNGILESRRPFGRTVLFLRDRGSVVALSGLLRGDFDGSYDFYRSYTLCRRRLNPSYLSDRQRLPTVVPDGFLPLLKDRWRRGRRYFCKSERS